MKFSVEKASRKWPCGGFGKCEAAMIAGAVALFTFYAPIDVAVAAQNSIVSSPGRLAEESRPKAQGSRLSSIPLPRPRPADAPTSAPDASTAGRQIPAPPEQQAMPAAEPSACRLALSDMVAVAQSIPDIHDAGGCGGEDLVRLEAVVLPDKHLVAVKPPAILRCVMALEVAGWIRTDIAPLVASLGSAIGEIDNFDSYECRGRNRVTGAALSEHGRANALDLRAVNLADGRSISFTDRAVPRGLRESIRQSACARFSTVLGPGSDWSHEGHIHLDLMARHNNYKICQWDVWDLLPRIAPLQPAERPAEAPPRKVAARSGARINDAGSEPGERTKSVK
jgi:hypothetical protein